MRQGSPSLVEGAGGSGLQQEACSRPSSADPPAPGIRLQWACVSARWRRTMCQEIIANKNSLGFILSFYFFWFRLGSLLPLKEATKLPSVTLF